MNYLLAVLAGAVQGLTEFLPISSTGHLIIFENVFKISQQDFGLSFDASLHLGTLLAILVFFYKDYLNAAKSRLAPALIVGTIPAVLAGIMTESIIETSLRQLWVVGAALVLFSFVIILAEKIGSQNKLKDNVTIRDAFLIGLTQALALIPGISRSGSTISGGLLLGMKREDAAKFAFMLSGPIVAGAGAKKFLETLTASNITGIDLNFFIIGITSSAIFGYFTIKYFLKYLSTKTLYPFVVYRIILGLLLLATSLANW